MKTLSGFVVIGIACLITTHTASGQKVPSSPIPTGQPASRLNLTFEDALNRARANSTEFQAAVTNLGLAVEDRAQSRNALLPTVTYNNSALYTQSTGLQNKLADSNVPPVKFIANGAVHEYISQGTAHAAIDIAAIANFRRLSAAASVARAKAEIASRGLAVTVAVRYYSVKAAQEKVTTAKELAAKGEEFLKLTRNLEHGGEIAHSDVIKAELQMLDRKRQVQEAQLALLNARLDLSIIIFADFNDNFEVVDDLHATPPLPALSTVQRLSMQQNPEIDAALAAVRAGSYDIVAARAAYLPPLTLDLFYGIDASHFALNSVSDGQKFSNLGYSGQATMNIPIWNWGTTQSRVKQAQLQQSQAKRELSLAERKLLADIESRYAEAEVALKDHGELNRSLELARDSLRLTTLRYKNAEAKVLEVVDAETALSSAASAYEDGAVRYHAAVANLQALTSLPSGP